MKSKLTLTIDQPVPETAKRHAKINHLSLSNTIENYLKAITKETGKNSMGITPMVKALKGHFRMPRKFIKKVRAKRLVRKYLRSIEK